MRMWTGLNRLRILLVVGYRERDDEQWGSVKGERFFDQLFYCHLHKEECGACR